MEKDKLDRLTQLNFELMETLELCLYVTQDFCQKNSIPFQNEKLSRLLDKVTRLIDEIDPPPFSIPPKLNRRKVTDFRTDEDETAPLKVKPFINYEQSENDHNVSSDRSKVSVEHDCRQGISTNLQVLIGTLSERFDSC
jgi:hypothetical protein